jgi:nucleotide sugar dehydrogenase
LQVDSKKDLEMRIAVLGTGYVGLVSAACFAPGGHRVTCVDIDEAKIAMLCRGEVPIYEPLLGKLIADGRRRKRLHFTSDAAAAVNGADIIFIAVGTPTRASDGHADLSQVYAAVEALVPFLKAGAIVVTKSTVPVGTGDTIEHLIGNTRPGLEFEVASNPEFLRAGRPVRDFLRPDRVGGSRNADVDYRNRPGFQWGTRALHGSQDSRILRWRAARQDHRGTGPYKADTDDMRDTVSIPLAQALSDAGNILKA